MAEEVYTTTQAAELLGVHVKTVVRWCQSGVLAGARIKYGSRKLGWRIPASSIAALQATNAQQLPFMPARRAKP